MAETPTKARSVATHKAVSPPIQPETAGECIKKALRALETMEASRV